MSENCGGVKILKNTKNETEDNEPIKSPPIMTTTNAYISSSPPIHICCYRSRHVQLCGKSNTPGEILFTGFVENMIIYLLRYQ